MIDLRGTNNYYKERNVEKKYSSNISHFLFKRTYNKPGIREKASNEDTDTEFLFAYLKPEGFIKKDELHLRITNKTITKLL